MFFRSYFYLIGPFNYISPYESLLQPWYYPLWLTGLKAPTNELNSNSIHRLTFAVTSCCSSSGLTFIQRNCKLARCVSAMHRLQSGSFLLLFTALLTHDIDQRFVMSPADRRSNQLHVWLNSRIDLHSPKALLPSFSTTTRPRAFLTLQCYLDNPSACLRRRAGTRAPIG